MAKPKVTEREVRIARSFLKNTGANESNTYLLLAVIAWLRHMRKAGDPFLRTMNGLTSYKAGYALASRLKARYRNNPSQYRSVLAALRRQVSKASATVTQARDFMIAIQKSPWDPKHYGYRPYVAGHWETKLVFGRPYTYWVAEQEERDPLSVTWSGLTGTKLPAAWFQDSTTVTKPPPPPPKPRPTQATQAFHGIPRAEYIQPYAAQGFYHARKHEGDYVLLPD